MKKKKRRRKKRFRVKPIVILDAALVLFLFLGVFLAARIMSKGVLDEKKALANQEENQEETTAQTQEDAIQQEETTTTPTEAAEENPTPTVTATPTPAVEKSQISLLFGGDFLISEDTAMIYDSEGISGIASSGLLDVLKGVNYVMVNMDFPFCSSGSPVSRDELFRASPERVSILKELGIDMVNTANDHYMDYGSQGAVESDTTLYNSSIRYVGSGETYAKANEASQIALGERKISFVSAVCNLSDDSWEATDETAGVATAGINDYLADKVKDVKTQNDFVFVYLNWGTENVATPDETQRTFAKQLIDAGADAVFGTSAHVIQGIEYYNGKPIVYNLGNFMYQSNVYESMMVKTAIDGKDQISLSIVPIKGSASKVWVLDDGTSVFQNVAANSVGCTVDDSGNVVQQ